MNRTVSGKTPFLLRFVSALLIPIYFSSLCSVRVFASALDTNRNGAITSAPEARPLAKVKVNMTAPAVQTAKPLSFSAEPNDGEFVKVRLFAEPLLPMGGHTSVEENKALAEAVLAFGQNPSSDAIEPLEKFMADYPESAWRVSLLTNMGIIYCSGGYWTDAFVAWQKAWEAGKNETDPTRRLIVDRALAQAADLALKISWTDYLRIFLEAAKGREISGPANEMLANARSGLYLMQKDETKTARCGPLAVRKILAALDPTKALSSKLKEPVPTDLGTTFVQINEFSKELGMDYQMAFRSPGAPIIVPCVVNWKVGHHAALTREINGRYVVEDVTFAKKFIISKKAIEREASGYFLVPMGDLPSGWRPVDKVEGVKVWGKGYVEPTTQPPPPDPKKRPCMAGYTIDFARINLQLSDTPLFYTPPYGPAIEFTVNYSQRDVAFSDVPNYPNLGSKWNFGWVCFIRDDPYNQDTQSYGPSGGQLTYSGFNGDRFDMEPHTRSILIRTSETSYLRTFPDGSRQVFGLADSSTPKRIFMTEFYDPAGNKISYNYDPSSFRLLSVTDSIGMVTTLTYVSDDSANIAEFYRIKQVTDPFERKATFDYNANGFLWKITDMGGISSEFIYGTGDFIAKLTTPYGDTTFESHDVDKDRSLLITDPAGKKEYVEFKYDQTPPDISSPQPQGILTSTDYYAGRNSFYWDKKAYAQAPGDYSAAKLMHWLHTADWQEMSDVLDSEKTPLESRVHYNYPGQGDPLLTGTSNQPSAIARVLDDGSTQLTQYEYNSVGNPIKIVTPGDTNTPSRTTTYKYASNDIDLLAVYQQNPAGQSIDSYGAAADLLQSFTYDTQGKHLVMSMTDASGQTTYFTRNEYGQVLTVMNPKNETTTFTYNQILDSNGQPDGYLVNIKGPVPTATTSLRYDKMYRLWKMADSQGYTVTTEYEAIDGDPLKTLDRPTKIKYPDTTTAEIIYNKLDAEWTKDRMGRWTHTLYNVNRQLEVIIDPLNRTTQYDWCSCGSLDSITDPASNKTTFIRDIQGRVKSKVFPDDKTLNYTYENTTSRLKSVLDAKGQQTNYQYNIDNSLRQVSYTDTAGNALNPATPSVSYTYDPVYPRILTMTDGIGTTQNSYNSVTLSAALGAGRLATVSGPWADAGVSYTYDELGRVATRSINGTANHSIFGYDRLGRPNAVTNPLGNFGYTYIGATGKIDTATNPNGQSTVFGYYDNLHDQRLQVIKHLNPSGGVISQFDYSYNLVGNILTWTQANSGLSNARSYTFGYDAADQLKSAQLKEDTTNAILKDLSYGYDNAANRTTVQESGTVSTETPNELNQLIQGTGGGMMRFAGQLSKPANVTVGGNPATLHGNNTFEGYAAVSSASTTRVDIVAVDANGNTTNKHVDVSPNAVPAKAYLYDNNGNMTAAGTAGAPEVTYGWDAANRLTRIIKSGTTTRFDYDGAGRRVREWTNGVETKRWVWVGLEVCEERDSSNAVTKRFYAQGEQIAGQSYYYTRDHLGSVREMTDNTGMVRARYDYDPYGKRSANLITANAVEADFGFTGHYQHVASGLTLAPYRAYAPGLGRWISRDPLMDEDGNGAEILQGPNLYEYSLNNPINVIDSLGLDYILLNQSEGFHGLGHSGSLVGNPKSGYDYYSKDGKASGNHTQHYNSLDDFDKCKTARRYDRRVTVPTTEAQDKAMKDWADQHYNDPFSNFSNNCHDLANDIMGAGGITPPSGATPNAQYNQLNTSNQIEQYLNGN